MTFQRAVLGKMVGGKGGKGVNVQLDREVGILVSWEERGVWCWL